MDEQEQPSHESNLIYNELRIEGKLCDAIIKVNHVEFPVHKIILCNCSPYFRALFTRWNDLNRMVFNIPGMSPHMMKLIIDFAYTGSVFVNNNNVEELLKAADQLNVMGIVKICCDHLGEQLCPDNCIGYWQFTNEYLVPELRAKAYQCILDNFEQIFPTEEFLQLTVEELAGILERDNLNVQEEGIAYVAVLTWIACAPAERMQHFLTLFFKLRVGLMNGEPQRVPSELVALNSECMAIVRHVMSSSFTSSALSCRSLVCPRLPRAILLAIGGWSGTDPTNGIEAFDYQVNRWVSVRNNLEYPRAYHGAAFLNGYVYCIGGFDRVEYFNSVCRLDMTTSTWREVSPMHHRRCYVSVTVLNGCIYAMGGYDGHVRLSTAERYQPNINQWTLIAPMQEQRSDASCTALYNRIYICGGFNGNECLQTAEYYSPESNQWTMISPMNSRRSGIGVIAYHNNIYAVGGFDGSNRLRSAEVYDPEHNVWSLVSSMLTPRSNFGIEVINHRLFVVGGFNGNSTTFNVESYSASQNEWSAARDMEIFRSAVSCCVVFGLPNLSEYTAPRDALALLHIQEEEEPVDPPNTI